MKLKILLVGCGKMGSAMLAKWRDNSDYVISVLEPNSQQFYRSAASIPEKSFDIIVLSVKPQVMEDVCNEISGELKSSLIISIAAGKSLKFFEDIFSNEQAIIRAMPNTPAMIGHGMTVAVKNINVDEKQIDMASNLLGALGKVAWIEDESLMDSVTAVSGSGPAYLFLLIEELAKAAMLQGLDAELAMTLARETVIGSALLAQNMKHTTVHELRQNVTSKGGTTEAALNVLMGDDGLGRLMERAVEAATRRSRELS